MDSTYSASVRANSVKQPVSMNEKHLVDALAKSLLFREYQKAFCETTGLPLTLRPVESWQLPFHGKRNESPFCGLMASESRSCASCLEVQQNLSDNSTLQPFTTVCRAGLSETAVPIRSGDKLIGFLQTGQVFSSKPSPAQFDRVAKLVSAWDVETDVPALRDAYFATPVLSSEQYSATVQMLAVFAQHLSIVCNQMSVHEETAEPVLITRAKQFIEDNHSEHLSLGQLAKAMNISPFYFCKMFKKFTGINFTAYLSKVRIDKAKNLLLNRSVPISEIAYAIGFQSLTHFNRVFKKICGQAPSGYRDHLPVG